MFSLDQNWEEPPAQSNPSPILLHPPPRFSPLGLGQPPAAGDGVHRHGAAQALFPSPPLLSFHPPSWQRQIDAMIRWRRPPWPSCRRARAPDGARAAVKRPSGGALCPEGWCSLPVVKAGPFAPEGVVLRPVPPRVRIGSRGTSAACGGAPFRRALGSFGLPARWRW